MPVCLQTLKMSIVERQRLFFVVTLFLCLAVFMDLCTYNIHTSVCSLYLSLPVFTARRMQLVCTAQTMDNAEHAIGIGIAFVSAQKLTPAYLSLFCKRILVCPMIRELCPKL